MVAWVGTPSSNSSLVFEHHRSGTKRFHHPLAGDLTLAYERLELPSDPGLGIVTYSAEPGSQSTAAIEELGRWSATRTRLAAVTAGDNA